MEKVTSKDGTTIAFDRVGAGPAFILVTGALATRSVAATISTRLAPHFTVFAYDRRGRGDSGDTQPYSVEREVEDLAAVIGAAGGSAFVFGHSSGAVLALEAARQLAGSITRLAVYEPPFIVDDSRPPLPADYLDRLHQFNAAGRPAEALEYFFTTAIGMPAEGVAAMRRDPSWPGLEKLAATLAYDGAIADEYMHGQPLPRGRWASLTMPTLVLDGGASPATMHRAAEALIAILPNAQHQRLAGQGHGADDDVLAPVLVQFFNSAQATDRGITITRVFDAPREVVFQAWTEPARFAKWFGLRDSVIPIESVSMDVRPGGTWRATMFAGPERHEIQWKGIYLEVAPPERLVFTLSDQPGPDADVITVRLADRGGKTEMVFQQRGGHLPEEGYARAQEGWSAFFDRLAELLT